MSVRYGTCVDCGATIAHTPVFGKVPARCKPHAKLLRHYGFASPEKQRRSALRCKYGITPEQFDELLAEQGGVCACCGASEHGGRNWCVDHDHNTGSIRGILCVRCNRGIGMIGDTVGCAKRVVSYLERSGDECSK